MALHSPIPDNATFPAMPKNSAIPAGLPRKSAIILASFGSTVPEAREAEDAFLRETQRRYPQISVVLANTARFVLKKNSAAGVNIPSLFRALADMVDAGYSNVVVQSLQLVPGHEFDGVVETAMAQGQLPKGLKKVTVGKPLLYSNEDCEKAATAILASLPAERKKDERVIFVGHGTDHSPGGLVYPAMQWHLARLDKNIIVSTIEGTPSQESTLSELPAPDKQKAVIWLAPMLALAGEHAKKDLYGEDENSWKSLLTQKGWQVEELFQPFLALPAMREIWFEHLDEALAAHIE